MSKPQGPCSKCKGEMSVKALDTFSGEESGVKVTVRSMPAAVCPQGHKRFLYPVFAGGLMDHAVDPELYGATPEAVKKGLFTKRYLCPGCGNELPASPTGAKTAERLVELKHADPFDFTVSYPVYKCGGCGKEFLRSVEETGKLAMKAVGHAYRNVDIHPT